METSSPPGPDVEHEVQTMPPEPRPAWAVRLETERNARRWGKHEMARRLFRARGIEHGAVRNLARQISDWEKGRNFPRDWADAYTIAFDTTRAELFGDDARVLTQGSAPIALPPRPQAPPGDYAATVRDTNSHLIVLDSRYGGTAIADVASQAFRSARTALATGRHNADERDLQAATGETGEIAAWCLYDADRLAESRAVTHEAMLISRLAGDRDMELFQLSHLALVDVHQRHSREALRIAEHTIDAGRLAPRVEALFRIRAARALAQGGHRHRALVSLGRANSALQESLHPRDPHWTWWLDSSELSWHRGILHLELGEYREAMPHLDDAAHGRLHRDPYAPTVQAGPVTARGEEWGRAAYNDLVHLLLALTMAGAWRDAEAIAGTVADFTREVVSARTEVMLRHSVRQAVRAAADGGGPSSTLLDLGHEIAVIRGWDLRTPGGG